VIWQGAVERVAALAVAALQVAVITWIWRSGALRKRAVVELRVDRRRRRTTLAVTADGKAAGAAQAVDPFIGGVQASLPGGAWRVLRIWPHEVTDDGWSSGLPADVELVDGAERTSVRLAGSEEPQLLPISGRGIEVVIRLSKEGTA
jgi:hypothetical protein